jgi:DNA-directed RNA polymerase subunit RPC12/RpoP
MEKRSIRSHYKIGPNGVLEEKKSFDTEQEALKMARFLNTKENIIHKMVAYKCAKCGKWHVGSNNTVLDEAERKKNKEKLRKNL